MSQQDFHSVGLITSIHDNAKIVEKLRKVLAQNNKKLIFEADQAQKFSPASPNEIQATSQEDFATQSDIICIVGGDGTLLNAIARYHQFCKPFTGINLGHVGFLVDLAPAGIERSFLDILNGKSCREHRMLLDCTIIRGTQEIAKNIAVNEVSFRAGEGNVTMIYLDVFIDNKPVHTESGDGLLVCTPTGSTAYNLSNGGPILAPDIKAICLTPICPNYLNSRPVVIHPDCLVEIQVDSGQRSSVQQCCDGQSIHPLQEGDKIRIRQHATPWTLLHPDDYEYFSLLRSKLNWGLQPPQKGSD